MSLQGVWGVEDSPINLGFYYLPFFFSFWDKALPAAVLLAALVLPSRKTLDAADAALLLVTFLAISINL
ncbi:MAG: hypothetical protein AB7O47_05735 [Flavobacteriales bacterium]